MHATAEDKHNRVWLRAHARAQDAQVNYMEDSERARDSEEARSGSVSPNCRKTPSLREKTENKPEFNNVWLS